MLGKSTLSGCLKGDLGKKEGENKGGGVRGKKKKGPVLIRSCVVTRSWR